LVCLSHDSSAAHRRTTDLSGHLPPGSGEHGTLVLSIKNGGLFTSPQIYANYVIGERPLNIFILSHSNFPVNLFSHAKDIFFPLHDFDLSFL